MRFPIFVKDDNEAEINFYVAVALMDDDIREEIHNENPNLTPQEFYDEYYTRHYYNYRYATLYNKVAYRYF